MRKNCLLIMILLVFIGLTAPVFSQYIVDTTVPLYGKEYLTWGGPAVGQMILDGYPGTGTSIYYSQPTVLTNIQNFNSTVEPDPWITDPLGLRETLMLLNPPLGSWGITVDADKNEVLFHALYWMNRNAYPVAALIDEGERWVVITGYDTDVEPIEGSSPTLNYITLNDPDPLNQGSTYTMNGAVWLATAWIAPVSAEGTWENLYVAVIEPPVAGGSVQVDTIDRNGGVAKSIISSQDALNYAHYWINELGISQKAPYTDLGSKSIVDREPMLVSEEIDAKLVAKKIAPYYYIVPFGFDGRKEVETPETSTLYLIINAYTGKFEEVGTFGKPVTYLSEDMALDAVASYLKITREELKDVKAELAFMPSTITHLRSRPFWRVTLPDDSVLFVEQSAHVHPIIIPAQVIYGK
jgi:hypothetical protein